MTERRPIHLRNWTSRRPLDRHSGKITLVIFAATVLLLTAPYWGPWIDAVCK